MRRAVSWIAFAPVVVLVLVGASASRAAAPIGLSEPLIVHAQAASDLEKLAARELLRYLYRGSGKVGAIAADTAVPDAPGRTRILLDVAANNRMVTSLEKAGSVKLDRTALGEEGFRWKVANADGQAVLVITAARPVGVLYGVYLLLERLGFGFYLGGDTFPATGSPLTVDAALDESHTPAFAVRGALPWGNLPNAAWDLEDWKYYYDQLSKQGFNFVGFHQYDHEPWCAYSWQGKLVGGGPMLTSLDRHLGTVRPLGTAQFGFGAADYFDRDPFTSRCRLQDKERDDQIRRSQRTLAQSFDYAHTRGLKVGLGFELVGDPTDAQVQAHLEARISALLGNYPMLDAVWFFQSENMGNAGTEVKPGTALDALVQKHTATFAYLGSPRRVAEGARLTGFFDLVYRIVRRQRPGLPVAINGWGGDAWMHFTDFFLGLDKTLPKDVIFASQDNIYPTAAPAVSRVYGQLPPDRPRWPIPWWNSDGGGTRRDMWAPQCNTRPFVPICRDALAKKCQGLLGIHWCTRDVEEVAAYQARFAWNPKLTLEEFYDCLATRCFGTRWGQRMSRILQDLEALGPRWTGSLGLATELEPSLVRGYPPTKPDNLRKLAEIRGQLTAIHQEMLSAGQKEGIERIDWLAITIDWVTGFDKAILALQVDGAAQKLLAEAEAAKSRGDAAAAKQKARAAWDAVAASGLREALQTYPRKMSTMSEFGSLARIQVKAYATYLDLRDRVQAVLGEAPQELPALPVPAGSAPLIVGRQPHCLVAAGQDLPVACVVVSGEPVGSCVLHYRELGAARWKDVAMANSFRRTYTASIPGADLKEEHVGVEWYVSAQGPSNRPTFWPKGYPSVVWSATIVPQAEKM